VRDTVFKILIKQKCRFFAVVKDKSEAVKYVKQRNLAQPNYRYDGNSLYDGLTCTVFASRLHKDYEHNVCFARRGHADRTAALRHALEAVQQRAIALNNPESTGFMSIFMSTTPAKNENLQAVDYCLWALQRFYSRKETKYLELIWPLVSMIYEIDPKMGEKRGATFAKKKRPF
jgi:hypothetical protein